MWIIQSQHDFVNRQVLVGIFVPDFLTKIPPSYFLLKIEKNILTHGSFQFSGSQLVCLPCYVAYIISNGWLCVIMQNCFHGILDCPDNNHHLPTSNEFYWWQQQLRMQPWALCIQITEVDTHHTIVLKPNIPKLEVYIYINFHILIKKKQ